MMLVIFLMLIYLISLTLHKTMIMTVHNQYPYIRLTSPVYFCNHGIYYEYPKRTNASTMMKIGFSFDPEQDVSGGILMYKVQRRRNTRSNRRSSIDPIYAKVIKETLKTIRLLIIWKIERSGQLKANIMLVEYDKELVLNEDRSAQLYEKIFVMPSNHYDVYG
jgi:hypothetical protein